MSLIWKYFERADDGNVKKARCLDVNCKGKTQVIKCSDGNTTGLKNHLKSFHSAAYAEFTLQTEQKNASKKIKRKVSTSPNNKSSFKQSKITTTVTNMIKYDDQHPVQREFYSLLLDVIIDGFLSFEFANLPATKTLVNFLNKRVTVKHSTTYSKLAEAKYKAMMVDMKNVITSKIENSCAFTSDIWTSRVNDAYLSLTLHFIDSEFNLHRWTPYCRDFGDERHTGEVIGNHLQNMRTDLNILSENLNVYGVTDNAANIQLGVRNCRVKNLPCNNHTLQLAIADAFEACDGMQNMQNKCKDIATLTHKSSLVEKAMFKKCNKYDHKPNKIHQQNDTRWNSHFQNMKDTLHHQKCIDELARENKIDCNMVPTIKEWNMIDGACEVLGKLSKTTKEWEKEKVPTVNLVTKELYTINCELKAFIENKNNKMHGIVFAKELQKAISKRFPKYGLNKFENAVGNLLDPEIKGLHLREENIFDSTVQSLEKVAVDLKYVDDSSELDDKENSVDESKISPLEKLRQKYHNVSIKPSKLAKSKLQKEIDHYMSLPYCESDNILKWWKTQSGSLLTLAKLARYYLCIPASSSKSERVFSCAGNVVTAKRSRLQASKVEMIVVLKQNKSLLKEHCES